MAWFDSLLLPWFVLAAAFAAFYARMLRSNLVEVLVRGLHPHGAREGRCRSGA